MQLSPFSRHLIPLRSKYPPQHPVLKHLQSMSETKLRSVISRAQRGDRHIYASSTGCKERVIKPMSSLLEVTGYELTVHRRLGQP
jgi:hypothetical protein